VNIDYRTKKLSKVCSDYTAATRKYGAPLAGVLQQRLTEIQASPNLKVLKTLPAPRCHALAGKRKGQYAVYLVHPMRLIFVPVGDEEVIRPDGYFLEDKIESVKIHSIEDYH
jgi:proteic killer suppression protein